jgi:hypothetical protein
LEWHIVNPFLLSKLNGCYFQFNPIHIGVCDYNHLPG